MTDVNVVAELNGDESTVKDFALVKSPPQDKTDPAFNANDVTLSTVMSSNSNESSPTDSRNSSKYDPVENETASSDRTTPRDNTSQAESKGSPFETESVVEPYDELSRASVSPNFRVIGQRLNTTSSFELETASAPDLNLSSVIVDSELQINASGKDWIKISHSGKEKLMLLPSANRYVELGTFEIAETLAATFDIPDDVEIVGLASMAVLSEDDSSKFKHHGELVIPLSFLASGQLKELIKDGNDTFPNFRLVTKKLCHFNSDGHGLENEFDVTSYNDAVSIGEFGEEQEYTDAFIDLMENSDEFSSVEKNVLLKFGVDEAERGNILFRAAFRLAAFTSDSSKFVMSLKAIAKVLEPGTFESSNIEDDSSQIVSPPSKTIFGLQEFISAADELFDGHDITADQYVAIIEAIYSANPEAEKLFELHCNPDFLLACDDENLRGELLIKDIMVLAHTLPAIAPEEPSDDQLKWAIHMGIHNFGTSLSDPLPVEFRNIIYHMFSSGDEVVLSACQQFLETDDNDVMDSMLQREWAIYCKNRDHFFNESEIEEVTSTGSTAANGDKPTAVPDILLTAVAALVDLDKISEDRAAVLIASLMRGNVLVKEAYDNFMKHGNCDEFLEDLEAIASDEQFTSSRALATSTPAKSRVPPPGFNARDAEENKAYVTFKEALEVIKQDDQFGSLEIAALRLASVKKDVFLANALSYYVETKDYSTFIQDLLYVARKVIYEMELTM